MPRQDCFSLHLCSILNGEAYNSPRPQKINKYILILQSLLKHSFHFKRFPPHQRHDEQIIDNLMRKQGKMQNCSKRLETFQVTLNSRGNTATFSKFAELHLLSKSRVCLTFYVCPSRYYCFKLEGSRLTKNLNANFICNFLIFQISLCGQNWIG